MLLFWVKLLVYIEIFVNEGKSLLLLLDILMYAFLNIVVIVR